MFFPPFACNAKMQLFCRAITAEKHYKTLIDFFQKLYFGAAVFKNNFVILLLYFLTIFTNH
jgi:hypothetical protein